MQDRVDFRSVAKKGSFEEIYKKLVWRVVQTQKLY